MYLLYNGERYSCKSKISSCEIVFSFLQDDFPSDVDGTITLCDDTGFVIKVVDCADFAKKSFLNGVLTLNNIEEEDDGLYLSEDEALIIIEDEFMVNPADAISEIMEVLNAED